MIHFSGCSMCGEPPNAPAMNDRGEPCPCGCHGLTPDEEAWVVDFLGQWADGVPIGDEEMP